jgi:tryptophanyl-tRNA synthetase
MSKSYGNAIYLSDAPEEIRKKMMDCLTDPARARRSDPGNPDICTLYDYHRLVSPAETLARVNLDCRAAKIGCVEDKKEACENLIKFLAPIQERRREWAAQEKKLKGILEAGSQSAKKIASETLKKVYEVMGLCI